MVLYGIARIQYHVVQLLLYCILTYVKTGGLRHTPPLLSFGVRVIFSILVVRDTMRTGVLVGVSKACLGCYPRVWEKKKEEWFCNISTDYMRVVLSRKRSREELLPISKEGFHTINQLYFLRCAT